MFPLSFNTYPPNKYLLEAFHNMWAMSCVTFLKSNKFWSSSGSSVSQETSKSCLSAYICETPSWEFCRHQPQSTTTLNPLPSPLIAYILPLIPYILPLSLIHFLNPEDSVKDIVPWTTFLVSEVCVFWQGVKICEGGVPYFSLFSHLFLTKSKPQNNTSQGNIN